MLIEAESADEAASPVATSSSVLRVLQLSSSLMPIGAFAYSQGLESAVEHGWVRDEHELAAWASGLFAHSVATLDLPILLRTYDAWSSDDAAAALNWSSRLLSFRESRELREQERGLGSGLARVLETLGVRQAQSLVHDERTSYVAGYALGCVHFGVASDDALLGYSFAWLEQIVSAAVRLVPLGHLAGQRALSCSLAEVPARAAEAKRRGDDDLGSLTPGLAMAAAWHESQYTRLFRS